MGLATPWSGEWRMECEGGEIAWSTGEGDRVIVTPVGKETYDVVLPKLTYTGRLSCLHAFLQAITSGQEPETSGRDNLHTLALVLAAVASARSGQPQLPEPLS
jgi:predicted dehydrogenase